MRRSLLAAPVVVLVLLAGAPGAAAAYVDPGHGVTIALVDTGINAEHQEFAPGQLVGYFDFASGHVPKTGQAFDPKSEPADDNGHGTLTASMAAGLNADPRKTPSFAPGFRLAMADVGKGDGTISGNLAAAIRWCVRTIHADVINISIGSIAPIPGAPLLFDEYLALQEARAAGALVVVANGNGTGNYGLVPGDGASSTYSSSRDVLAVGAAGTAGATVSYQPEVAAQYTVTGPTHDSTDEYVTESGTSFASPLTAGFAARLLAEAREAGRALTPDALETLVKYAARDTTMPPVWEGYGVLDAGQLAAAVGHARAGTLPARPSPDVNALYVERVAGTERDLNAADPRPPAG